MGDISKSEVLFSILVVDDGPVDANLLGHILKDEGYAVRVATDGKSALELACSEPPDLILLDICMPDMDGYEVCSRLRTEEATREIPIIFTTALETQENEKLGLDMGAADYIVKPLRPEIVKARIRNHLQAIAEYKTLKQSNSQLIAVLDRLKIGSMIVGPNENILFVSGSLAEAINVDSRNVTGRKWSDVLPFDDKQLQVLRSTLKGQASEGSAISLLWERRDGTVYSGEVEVQAHPEYPDSTILYFYDKSELHKLRCELSQARHGKIIGSSPPMLQLYRTIEQIAQGDWTVLIEGETGVGKELVAHAIHAASPRAKRPFIAVNCASLTESLLASQLYGHRRGAFSGAHTDQEGFFQAAEGGTIFLDEITETCQGFQASLLRVLQEHEIYRIGESLPRKIDVRIIVATNKEIEEEVNNGSFRKDLFFRLNIARVKVPPLRERREDIPVLAAAFLADSRPTDSVTKEIGKAAMTAMMNYSWPGNVRELRNLIEKLSIFCAGPIIRSEDLPSEFHAAGEDRREGQEPPVIEADELSELLSAVERTQGNRSKAAELLGISRATLYRRLSKFNLT